MRERNGREMDDLWLDKGSGVRKGVRVEGKQRLVYLESCGLQLTQ